MTEITNVTVTPKTFEEKMHAKIKESLGDFIDDEALRKVIDRGIEAALFEPRTITTLDDWGRSTKVIQPPLVQEVLVTALEPYVKVAVDNLITERSDEVVALVQKVLQEGAGDLLLKTISSKFSSELSMFESSLIQRIHNAGGGRVI